MYMERANTPYIVSPDSIHWLPYHVLPSGAESAVLLGNRSDEGVYVMRLKVPGNVRIMPHSHGGNRIYTVISGRFVIGFGDKFAVSMLQEFGEGGVISVPANVELFQYSKSTGYIVQVQGSGPTDTVYVNPADDPRL